MLFDMHTYDGHMSRQQDMFMGMLVTQTCAPTYNVSQLHATITGVLKTLIRCSCASSNLDA
jgi:hypothetical protein